MPHEKVEGISAPWTAPLLHALQACMNPLVIAVLISLIVKRTECHYM